MNLKSSCVLSQMLRTAYMCSSNVGEWCQSHQESFMFMQLQTTVSLLADCYLPPAGGRLQLPMLCASAASESPSNGKSLHAITVGMPMLCAGAALESPDVVRRRSTRQPKRWKISLRVFLGMPRLCACTALESLSDMAPCDHFGSAVRMQA